MEHLTQVCYDHSTVVFNEGHRICGKKPHTVSSKFIWPTIHKIFGSGMTVWGGNRCNASKCSFPWSFRVPDRVINCLCICPHKVVSCQIWVHFLLCYSNPYIWAQCHLFWKTVHRLCVFPFKEMCTNWDFLVFEPNLASVLILILEKYTKVISVYLSIQCTS